MGGSVKAAGLGDGSWKYARPITKLRVTLPHERLEPDLSFDR